MKNDLCLRSNQEETTITPNERTTSHAITRCNRGAKREGTPITQLRSKKQAFSLWSKLPLDDLLPNIVKWFPLESLCRFKSVSKTWRTIITDHFNGLKRGSIFAMLFEKWNVWTPKLNAFGLCSIDAETGIAHPRWNRLVEFSYSNYRICNGLFCLLTTFSNSKLAIYNPFTQDQPLPLPRMKSYSFASYSFGFDPLSKKYKVFVWTSYPNCLIHTVGTKLWRRISNAPPAYKIGSKRFQSVCINGVIFFYCKFTNSVISFNLSTECFGTFEGCLPLNLKEGRVSSIFEFEGCLSLTYLHDNNPQYYDLWMFKNTAKWVMVKRIVLPAKDRSWCEPYSIRTGEIIFASSNEGSRILYAYSFHTGKLDTIKVIGLDSKVTFAITEYVESSQSLQDLLD